MPDPIVLYTVNPFKCEDFFIQRNAVSLPEGSTPVVIGGVLVWHCVSTEVQCLACCPCLWRGTLVPHSGGEDGTASCSARGHCACGHCGRGHCAQAGPWPASSPGWC